MSRRGLSVEAFGKLTWKTPTQAAEAVYAANRRPAARRSVVGPAGIEIPLAKAVYSRAQDGPVLVAIIKAAYADHVAAQLPADRAARIAGLLTIDLCQRYPVADMEVLERYGFARPTDRISIVLDFPGEYLRPFWLTMPEPLVLPAGVACYRGGELGVAHPLPAAALLFAEAAAAVQRAEKRDFRDASHGVSVFKARHGRWPTWAEIATEWPAIGAWMDAQRKGAR